MNLEGALSLVVHEESLQSIPAFIEFHCTWCLCGLQLSLSFNAPFSDSQWSCDCYVHKCYSFSESKTQVRQLQQLRANALPGCLPQVCSCLRRTTYTKRVEGSHTIKAKPSWQGFQFYGLLLMLLILITFSSFVSKYSSSTNTNWQVETRVSRPCPHWRIESPSIDNSFPNKQLWLSNKRANWITPLCASSEKARLSIDFKKPTLKQEASLTKWNTIYTSY